jgi:hypothetical protein
MVEQKTRKYSLKRIESIIKKLLLLSYILAGICGFMLAFILVGWR